MNVKVLFVGTKLTAGVSNYEKSLDTFHYTYERLGIGQAWGGWRFRMKLYMDTCNTYPADTILILTDADDVLCVKSSEGLLDTFLSYNKPIVVGAETVCVGYNCCPITTYWKSNTHDKSSAIYANCGTMMGRAGELAIMWKWMLDNNYKDDQFALGNYINAFPEKFYVDTYNSLFYIIPPPVIFRLHPTKFEWTQNNENNFYAKSIYDGVDQRHATPYFFHFAGNFIEPTLQSMFSFKPSEKLVYDETAKKILKDKAMAYHQTCEDARKVGVAITWTMVGILLAVILILVVLFFVYKRKHDKQHVLTKQDHSVKQSEPFKKL